MSKNKHAVALGRNGGKATARKLTKPERIASARHAAMKRWDRIRQSDIARNLDDMRSDRQDLCQVPGNGENK